MGGSNLILSPNVMKSLTSMGFLSNNGRSFGFDSRASGYGRGEGNVVVVLQRLADAINRGSTIRAVIRASGSAADGHTPTIYQPSKRAQEELIRDTYQKSGLDVAKTRYVEAHGTGTQTGYVL